MTRLLFISVQRCICVRTYIPATVGLDFISFASLFLLRRNGRERKKREEGVGEKKEEDG